MALAVNKRGGWLQVTGADEWNLIPSCNTHNARKDYEKFLFPILKSLEEDCKRQYDIRQLHPECIIPIRIFTPPTNGQLAPAFWDEVMLQDIAILRDFTNDVWGLNSALFSIDHLEKHFGKQEIDVLVQDRDPDSSAMKLRAGEKTKMTIKEFVSRMKGGGQSGPVQFGVNIDIGSWGSQMDELQAKLPEMVLFGSRLDALSYTRTHIYGMTLPQLYLKLAGSWTGAHQENLSFASININHGPGTSIWWALDPQHNSELRQEVRERCHFDILTSETLWWPDENFLMSHGYKTFFGLQRPGDLVYVGPGTMHWVKSVSAGVNSSWNIGNKTFRQFKAAFDRMDLNAEVGLESLVPMNTLAMDLLNSELTHLPADLVSLLTERVHRKFLESQQVVKCSDFRDAGICVGHQVRRCEFCKGELMFIYTVCEACSEAYCFTCARNHKHAISLFYRMFNSENFDRLMNRVQSRHDLGFMDCYDPGLSLHVDKAKKNETVKMNPSVFRGAPSYIWFKVKEPERVSKAIKRTRSEKKKPHSKKPKLEKKVKGSGSSIPDQDVDSGSELPFTSVKFDDEEEPTPTSEAFQS